MNESLMRYDFTYRYSYCNSDGKPIGCLGGKHLSVIYNLDQITTEEVENLIESTTDLRELEQENRVVVMEPSMVDKLAKIFKNKTEKE